MKYTSRKVILNIFIGALLCGAAQPAHAVFFSWGGEKINKMIDLPDTAEFQYKDGPFVDIGLRYKQISIFFIPLWNYDKKWCGYVGSDSQYIDLDLSEASDWARSTELGKLPSNMSLPFWDSVGGKLLLLGLILLFYFYETKKKVQDEEKESIDEIAQVTFTCPRCAQGLEAPDDMKGQLVECPSCNETVEVPSGKNTLALAATPSKSIDEIAQVTFTCPKCAQGLKAPDDMKGQLVECPSCNETVEVPSGKNTLALAATPSKSKECPYCSEEILATARKCKHCGEILDPALGNAVPAIGRQAPHTSNHQSRGTSQPIQRGNPFGWAILGVFAGGLLGYWMVDFLVLFLGFTDITNLAGAVVGAATIGILAFSSSKKNNGGPPPWLWQSWKSKKK